MTDPVRELAAREEQLAEALLPREPDPTETLGTRERFLTRSYVVLVCAVIEEFVEDCFGRYVHAALEASGSQVAPCFVSLAARYGDDVGAQLRRRPPEAAAACPTLRSLYIRKVVRTNNGLKRRNFVNLARPLGLLSKIENECEDLMRPADVLGGRRGEIAHLGAVDEELRPREARALVRDVVNRLDLLVVALGLERGPQE